MDALCFPFHETDMERLLQSHEVQLQGSKQDVNNANTRTHARVGWYTLCTVFQKHFLNILVSMFLRVFFMFETKKRVPFVCTTGNTIHLRMAQAWYEGMDIWIAHTHICFTVLVRTNTFIPIQNPIFPNPKSNLLS